MRRGFSMWVIMAAGLVAGVFSNARADDDSMAQYYGFHSPEIYKLGSRIQNVLVRDLNADGLNDLVIVNNLQNRIDVLEQRKPGAKPKVRVLEVNELPNDWRFDHRKIPMNRPVTALEVQDVNGDKLPDLVYLGEPADLYVEYQGKDGRFSQRKSFDIKDAQSNMWCLDVGDLNQDGRNDIAFTGREHLYILLQTKEGTMSAPKRYRLSEGGGKLLRIADIDGDGTRDLIYMSDDTQFPVRVRFQNKEGRLGPERRFHIDRAQGVAYADVDGKPGIEILIASETSNRILIYALGAPTKRDEDAPIGEQVTFAFEKSGSSPDTDVTVADVDGDKHLDVLVSDPDSAQILIYRQTEKSGLDLGQSFPAMLGTTLLRAGDVDNDGTVEVLSLSEKDKSIGVSRFTNGRLSFPQALPTRDEPVVMELMTEGNVTFLVYLARVRDAAGDEKFFLRRLEAKRVKDELTWIAAKFGEREELPVAGTTKPSNLRAVDVNADGKLDLLRFFAFDPPIVWIADGKGGYAAPRSSQGSLGNITPSAVFFGMVDGPTPDLLVAQANFTRKYHLDPNGRWKVLDQYNAAELGAKVQGITVLDVDGDQQPELAMYEREAGAIVFLKRIDGVFRRWKQLKVGGYALKGMFVGDFDRDGRQDLLIYDADKMGIAYTGKQEATLQLLGSYESNIPNGKVMDVAAGDLNHDGQVDILAIEAKEHHLEVLAYRAPDQFRVGARWKVFEEKTFRMGVGSSIEPRESAMGDVDNDGRDDLIILVHDRALVYRQDNGIVPRKQPARMASEKTSPKPAANGHSNEQKANGTAPAPAPTKPAPKASAAPKAGG